MPKGSVRLASALFCVEIGLEIRHSMPGQHGLVPLLPRPWGWRGALEGIQVVESVTSLADCLLRLTTEAVEDAGRATPSSTLC